ncbi:MAG: phosphate acyltransferase [Prevotella sp.]
MKSISNFDNLLDHLRNAKRRKTVAVACPADSHTEYVVKRALDEGIADFIFVYGAPETPEFARIRCAYGSRVSAIYLSNPDDAARKAVETVRGGNADVLMKGTINTDILLKAVLDKNKGLLLPGHVLSHVTLASIPSYSKMIAFSDAAVVPRPTLEQFEAIVGYVSSVCHDIGINCPRVALIHCTEKTSDRFAHTISYAEIIHKAVEGAYGDILIDGPMDVKTACDSESGNIKGMSSPVIGNADALIFPNIESGNVFYKTITMFCHAETAGMLCGTTHPVVVASRADSCESKFYSLALGIIKNI